MTHFLYKPHIAGPENNITTPDLVIDRVEVHSGGDGRFVPVQRLLSAVELQSPSGNTEITPAYALAAAGGGVLVGLAALICDPGDPPTKADLLVARSAWRLRNIIEHFESLELGLSHDNRSESASVASLVQPADLLNQSKNEEPAMARGTMILCSASEASITAIPPASVTIELADKKLDRRLSHTASLVPVDHDRWEERPLPRYTVGPVGEVEHYI